MIATMITMVENQIRNNLRKSRSDPRELQQESQAQAYHLPLVQSAAVPTPLQLLHHQLAMTAQACLVTRKIKQTTQRILMGMKISYLLGFSKSDLNVSFALMTEAVMHVVLTAVAEMKAKMKTENVVAEKITTVMLLDLSATFRRAQYERADTRPSHHRRMRNHQFNVLSEPMYLCVAMPFTVNAVKRIWHQCLIEKTELWVAEKNSVVPYASVLVIAWCLSLTLV
mmetsp:Transcript_10298/g.14441  ORF Transcript_10298/g.14441 Transcript_10298/m.14441 type:complete len:226 (+) Transcript_10298:243-920(+)